MATSKLFLKNGLNIIITDINSNDKILDNLNKDYKNKVHFFKPNVSINSDVVNLYEYTKANIGTIHSLINNASIFISGLLHEVSEEDWDKIFNIDIKSVFLVSKYYINDIIANGSGTIVNTASISGMFEDYNMSVYNTAKSAVVNLVRSMALDYGKFNIRINNVCPSAFATPIFLSNPKEII